ncbi:MAG: hypothetical protein ACRDT6_19820 [Micromonosporaceae bacterium]
MPDHTVIGCWDNARPVVVGVVVGAHEVYGGDEQRFDEGLWATTVDADDIDHAEALAKQEMTENGL